MPRSKRPLWARDPENMAERVSLDLAAAFERARNPGYSAVSCARQQEAADFVAQHGVDAAIAKVLELDGPWWLGPDDKLTPRDDYDRALLTSRYAKRECT